MPLAGGMLTHRNVPWMLPGIGKGTLSSLGAVGCSRGNFKALHSVIFLRLCDFLRLDQRPTRHHSHSLDSCVVARCGSAQVQNTEGPGSGQTCPSPVFSTAQHCVLTLGWTGSCYHVPSCCCYCSGGRVSDLSYNTVFKHFFNMFWP